MWIVLSYNSKVKDHIVHPSLAEAVEKDILERYQKTLDGKTEIAELQLDPGGMLCLKNDPQQLIYDGLVVSVRPELILNTITGWSTFRVLPFKSPKNENVIKIYVNQLAVIVIPKDFYHKIGEWLIGNKTNGYLARMELVEALGDVKNVTILPPPSEGEA